MANQDDKHTAMTLSRASRDDLPMLLTLIREFYALDRHVFDESRVRSALLPLLDDDRFGLVWTIGEPVDGYAVLTWGYSIESGGQEALIDEIYLRHRGVGTGSAILQAIVEDCRARGCRRMFLETESHNVRVRSFYGRAGFREDDSVWMSRFL